MKGIAIINPAAGGGRCGERAPKALAKLEREGIQLRPYYTSRPGEATEMTQQLWADGERVFVAIGGDGTGYEIINGLFPKVGSDRASLGFLTLGTGNSFVRDKGIHSTEQAFTSLIRGQTQPCDVVRLEYVGGVLHYINLLSIGFSARVASLTNQRFKPLGDAGYALAVVASLIRHQHPVHPYAADSNSMDLRPHTLISFSNSRFTGGKMMMAPTADIADGRLDIIRINAISRNRLLRAFPKIYRGKHVDLPVVESTQAQTVDFNLDGPIDVMVDGEVHHIQPTRLEVLPNALEVIL